MKFIFTTLLFFSITLSLPAQSLKIEKEFNSSYYELNELEINLTADEISISKNNQNIYIESLSGKKNFKSSLAENYFLIANFQFSNEKIDYPVEVRVFDRNGQDIFPFKFLASFDLPHPILNINDNGVLALFDPLSFKVKLVGQETYNEIKLEKDVPFEMEKAAFVEMDDDFLFILTSQSALDITENASNAALYQVNIQDLSVKKKEIDYNTPTLLKIIGGYLFVSGVKFENLKPIGKTIKYDLQLNQLASNEKIIEKLIPHSNGFYAKYFNTLYDLKNDISVLSEKQLTGGERITDIALSNGKLLVVTTISGEDNGYIFLPDLSIDFKISLNILDVKKIESFSIHNNYLIIHHDSKSTKIKINNN
jgi:hypothetical protein